MTSKFDNSDIWAAYRGLEMGKMDNRQLSETLEQHKDSEYFAGQVIAEAASQALAMNKQLNRDPQC